MHILWCFHHLKGFLCRILSIKLYQPLGYHWPVLPPESECPVAITTSKGLASFSAKIRTVGRNFGTTSASLFNKWITKWNMLNKTQNMWKVKGILMNKCNIFQEHIGMATDESRICMIATLTNVHAAPALVEINLVGEQAAPTTVFRSRGLCCFSVKICPKISGPHQTSIPFGRIPKLCLSLPAKGKLPLGRGTYISGSIWEL